MNNYLINLPIIYYYTDKNFESQFTTQEGLPTIENIAAFLTLNSLINTFLLFTINFVPYPSLRYFGFPYHQ
jgi:hypothetical protein